MLKWKFMKVGKKYPISSPWWRHQMETFSALLAICAGNSPVPGEFPTQRPVTRSFDVYFDLRPNKRLSKQSWGWWFETLSCSLCRHRNDPTLYWIKDYLSALTRSYGGRLWHRVWISDRYISLHCDDTLDIGAYIFMLIDWISLGITIHHWF